MTQTDLKQRFLRAAVDYGALKFGQFTLKSGRVSPYFFNAGAFNDGAAFALLGECYAATSEGLAFDGLFGPAYKGIPLATAMSIELSRQGRNVPVTFNRKEAKTHGEGGVLMGAVPAGRVLVVDDVITAGTAVREAMAQLTDCEVAGLVVALDRQERGQGELSAIQELQAEGLTVRSLVNLDDVLAFAQAHAAEHVEQIQVYRESYGARNLY